MSLGKGVIKGIRPLNLFIIAFTFYGMHCVIEGMSSLDPEAHFISGRLFFSLMLSIVLLAAGGNLINDLEDVEVDAYNRPGKNPIPILLGVEKAWFLYIIFTLFGLLIGMISLLFLESFNLWGLHIFIAGSLWYYSYLMQRQPLIGNFMVALLCGSIPVLVLLYENAHSALAPWVMYALLFYALLAFLLTFMREIVKDIEDIQGDATYGYRTLPVAYGIRISKGLFILLAVSAIALESWMIYQLQFVLPSIQMLIYFSLLFFPLLLISIFLTLMAKEKEDFHGASSMLKWTIAAGISTSFLFQFT